MGRGRTLSKKPVTRPRKSAGERRRRDMVQKKRLVALGMAPEAVEKLTSRKVKDLLNRPKKLAASG